MPSGLDAFADAYAASNNRSRASRFGLPTEGLPFEHMRHWPTAPKTATVYPPDGEDVPVAPDVDLENPSAFESTLKTLGLGGNAVRNLFLGNLEGVGRNAVDLLTSPIRAVLPGDQSNWELSRKEDLPEASDLFGGMEPGLGKTAVDLVGGILTDPLSYVGIGEFTAAAKAAKVANAAIKTARASGDAVKLLDATAAAKMATDALKASRASGETRTAIGLGKAPFLSPEWELPGTAAGLGYAKQGVGKLTDLATQGIRKVPGGDDMLKGAGAFGSSVKGLFGAQKPTQEIAENVAGAEALGAGARTAGQAAPVATFASTPADIQRMAVETLRGVSSKDGVYTDLGLESAKEFLTKPEQMALIDQRLAKSGMDDATKLAVRDATEKIVDYTRGKWKEGVGNKVFTPGAAEAASQASKDAEMWMRINKPLPGGGAGDLTPMAHAAEDLAPADYFPGRYEIPDAINDLAPAGKVGQPAPIKAASIKTSKDLVEYLNKTKGTLETDAGKILAEYGESLGKATQSANLGSRTVGADFKALADPASRKLMNDAIAGLRKAGDHDSANVLDAAFNGLTAPSGFWKILSGINKPFKAAATAGVVIPRLQFTIGNVASNVMQFASNPEARKVAFKQLKSLPSVIKGAFSDGLKTLGAKLPESAFDEVAQAAKESGGTREGMLKLIKDPILKLAVEHGVLDGGFVSAEQLATKFATVKSPKNWRNWASWTQDIAKGSEQRMRLNGFKDLIESGERPEDAARIINDTLFDYKYSSVGNRNLRQLAPFGQYRFKAVPLAAKFLAEKPAAAVGLNALYGQNDANEHPLPPWTNGNVNLPIGAGPTGEPQYLTNFRMPFEQLAQIPNPSGSLSSLIADTRSDVIGQSSPLVKTAIGIAGGNDPFSGQPFLSSDRAPEALQALGMQPGSNAARYYNAAAGTGIIQPAVSVINSLSNLLDKRQSVPVAALNSLTGLKVISVDEAKAMQQVIQDQIKRDPSIKGTLSYYQLSKTPDGQALLKKLSEVQKGLRAQRKQAKAAQP